MLGLRLPVEKKFTIRVACPEDYKQKMKLVQYNYLTNI